jgi:hypothetical protein
MHHAVEGCRFRETMVFVQECVCVIIYLDADCIGYECGIYGLDTLYRCRSDDSHGLYPMTVNNGNIHKISPNMAELCVNTPT